MLLLYFLKHWFPIFEVLRHKCGLPKWFSSKESAFQCRRCGFNPWVMKIPWRSKWQPTPVFLPGKSHGRGVWWDIVHEVAKESDTTYQLNNNRHI